MSGRSLGAEPQSGRSRRQVSLGQATLGTGLARQRADLRDGQGRSLDGAARALREARDLGRLHDRGSLVGDLGSHVLARVSGDQSGDQRRVDATPHRATVGAGQAGSADTIGDGEQTLSERGTDDGSGGDDLGHVILTFVCGLVALVCSASLVPVSQTVKPFLELFSEDGGNGVKEPEDEY